MKVIRIAAMLVVAICVPALADDGVKLEYRNSDMREVVGLYERLVSKKLVSDITVQGGIYLVTDAPVNRKTAIDLIEKTLLKNGFALVDTGVDTIRILGPGSPAIELPVYSTPAEIPRGERLFKYVITVKHCDITDLYVLLARRTTVSAYNTWTRLTFDPTTGRVVVTACTTALRTILRTVAAFDVPEHKPKTINNKTNGS